MSSIRPLITITILAVVGAYLYVKINEGPARPHARAKHGTIQPTKACRRWPQPLVHSLPPPMPRRRGRTSVTGRARCTTGGTSDHLLPFRPPPRHRTCTDMPTFPTAKHRLSQSFR